jgi:hypothetical protein
MIVRLFSATKSQNMVHILVQKVRKEKSAPCSCRKTNNYIDFNTHRMQSALVQGAELIFETFFSSPP